ncbi:MAG: TonB-dependent receptor plug domain-containing protein [Bacteroidales bacterium]|nr:TonB-dependent receptor plug domain-containing protein [Bacteroidales bacterium]
MKKKLHPLRTMLILPVIVVLTGSMSADDPRFTRISDALNRFTYVYPQQKVYLHTDKDEYRGGENMWIKAYLVNGRDHYPDTLSTNLYVELISPYQTRVQIKIFQLFRGFGIGDFVLSDTLSEGLYQLRAYTTWMQNFDSDYFFEKNFQLVNPQYVKQISPREARNNKKELADAIKLEAPVDLQFMPEGGHLVSGLESVVGFKAVNRMGMGAAVQGKVVDDKGNVAATFSTLRKGMGRFTLTPAAGRKYVALIEADDRQLKFPLPEALPYGLVMHAENGVKEIKLSVTSNQPVVSDPSANELLVTGQVGGQLYFYQVVRLSDGKALINVNKNIFPGGIVQFTVFSGRSEPLAERLVFLNRNDFMRIRVMASDTFTDNGMQTAVDIEVRDVLNRPLTANLSLAVTSDRPESPYVNRDNVVSNLLLTSDLKGFIEDPLDYFTSVSDENMLALDNLMLTQGWRRFDWNSLLAGRYPMIRHHEEKGLTIKGRITHDFFNIPLKNCRVQLSVMDAYNDVFTQYTSDKGYFLFEKLVYYDTISAKIEAWRTSGRRNLVIALAEENQSPVMAHQGEYRLTTVSERDQKAYRLEVSEELRKAYAEEQERLAEERNNNILTGPYGEPDYILYAKDIPQTSPNVLEAMKGRIPGVNIAGSQVTIRGPSTIYGNTEPLYLLDGSPVSNVQSILSIPVADIERVEVLKGPKASFYGVRGANGVIAVYTKRGHYMVRGKIEFEMLGYHYPRVFYQPAYTPEDEPEEQYTLFWEPVVMTNAQGKARVLLNKPGVQGNFRFNLQGISYMGHTGFSSMVISNH